MQPWWSMRQLKFTSAQKPFAQPYGDWQSSTSVHFAPCLPGCAEHFC